MFKAFNTVYIIKNALQFNQNRSILFKTVELAKYKKSLVDFKEIRGKPLNAFYNTLNST